MRMERVSSETSRRITQLQQQLSEHQLSCSDEDEEEEEEEEKDEEDLLVCPTYTIIIIIVGMLGQRRPVGY